MLSRQLRVSWSKQVARPPEVLLIRRSEDNGNDLHSSFLSYGAGRCSQGTGGPPRTLSVRFNFRDVRRRAFRETNHCWLVNKAKVESKTVQSILRHSRIQTTLDLYTQKDCEETQAAQGQFLEAVMASGGLQ